MKNIIIAAIFLLPSFILSTSTLYAEEIAELFSASTKVEVLSVSSKSWVNVNKGYRFSEGESVRTDSAGKAGILFLDGGLVRLSENSVLEFKITKKEDQKDLVLDKGQAFFFSREPKRFPNIITPSVSAAVRGTEFVVQASSANTTISVLDGAVEVSNRFGVETLRSNETATTKKGEAPIKSILVNPLDAVQWAIYVPKISDSKSNNSKNTNLSQELSKISELLSSGKVDSASKKLDIYEKNHKKISNGQDLAVYQSEKAFIALLKNQKSEALKLSTEALKNNPEDIFSLFAASYIDQAHFNLKNSRDSLNKILILDPNNKLAQARLAEILLSLGDVKGAENLLLKLDAKNSDNPLLLSVSGFLELIKYEPAKAEIIFSKATDQNSGSGLPWFGLGLSKINQGNLIEGRKAIEIACALEPNVSIYRSYLGKAYYEELREGLADHEYDRAIALDPNDPTPHLYRAYNNLSKNEVVSALVEIEDSITLNNNRAVYRSSLLLDQDSAVRSAGLAETFSALGFSKAAQVEAIKSINRDYSNYSAHRLLSDSYATIQGVDALLSERNISNLFSPLSFNIFNNPGSATSLGEYNSLYERPEHKTQIGFQGSTREDLLLPSAFVAGRTQKFGYLLGVESANSNGSKDNNYLRDHRFRAAAQYQPTYQDRFLLEGRYQARHLNDDNSALDDVLFDSREFDLGYTHQFSSETKLISQISYKNLKDHLRGFNQRPVNLGIISGSELFEYEDLLNIREAAEEQIKDLRLSLQLYNNTDLISTIIGSEAYFAHPRRTEDSLVLGDELSVFPDIGYRLPSESKPDISSQDIYIYPTLHLAKWIDLNLGLTYSNLDLENTEFSPYVDSEQSRNRWNPKIGASVYATSKLTLKAAYFETLRKSGLDDTGTIEPTLVGGFNQIYNDFSGTRSRNYGVGFDYKAAKYTYFGLQGVHRDTIEDSNEIATNISLDYDSLINTVENSLSARFEDHYNQEYLSGYVYQVINKNWVSTFDYNWFMSELTDPDIYQNIDLHKGVLALRYFSPNGWFAFTEASYRNQERQGGFFELDGNSEFWLVDLGVGYRFSKRQGSITFRCNNLFDKDFVLDQSLGFEQIVDSNISGEIAVNFNF
ncbi:MAG: FecR domain-containing protein [bacterium]|nr:FecR domain-containing protein [bacterium]